MVVPMRERTCFWQICKSLPLPAFVSKTPEARRSLLRCSLCTRAKVWKTPSQSVLNLHTVVREKGCCLCFLFSFPPDERRAGSNKATFPPVRFLQLACDLCGIQQCREPHSLNRQRPSDYPPRRLYSMVPGLMVSKCFSCVL